MPSPGEAESSLVLLLSLRFILLFASTTRRRLKAKMTRRIADAARNYSEFSYLTSYLRRSNLPLFRVHARKRTKKKIRMTFSLNMIRSLHSPLKRNVMLYGLGGKLIEGRNEYSAGRVRFVVDSLNGHVIDGGYTVAIQQPPYASANVVKIK